jgi:hypothetical protein
MYAKEIMSANAISCLFREAESVYLIVSRPSATSRGYAAKENI